MTPKTKFPRSEALAVAEQILDRLRPFCERCAIAGSIRRRCAMVGDIEILFVPKLAPDRSTFLSALMEGRIDMVDMAETVINRLEQDGVLKKRANVRGSFMWGKQNKFAVHAKSGIPVDFFATTHEKWFVALVIRTGGKRTNLALTMGANKRGLTLHAYGDGFTQLKGGAHVTCRSEREVFEIAGVPFSEPQFRK